MVLVASWRDSGVAGSTTQSGTAITTPPHPTLPLPPTPPHATHTQLTFAHQRNRLVEWHEGRRANTARCDCLEGVRPAEAVIGFDRHVELEARRGKRARVLGLCNGQ